MDDENEKNYAAFAYGSCIVGNHGTGSGESYEFTPNDMLATSQLVHDYWVDNGFYDSQYTPDTNWIYGAYHIGEFEYAKLTGNGKAWDNTLSWARAFSYEPHGSCTTTHADHQPPDRCFLNWLLWSMNRPLPWTA